MNRRARHGRAARGLSGACVLIGLGVWLLALAPRRPGARVAPPGLAEASAAATAPPHDSQGGPADGRGRHGGDHPAKEAEEQEKSAASEEAPQQAVAHTAAQPDAAEEPTPDKDHHHPHLPRLQRPAHAEAAPAREAQHDAGHESGEAAGGRKPHFPVEDAEVQEEEEAAADAQEEAEEEEDEEIAVGGNLTMLLLGAVLFLRGLLAVWAGEQEGLRAVRLFQRARRIAVHASAAIEPANQGRLVHVQGLTASVETLRDPLFGVEVKDTLKLRRKVEMFQWTEHVETSVRDLPGGAKEEATTYSYRAGWHPVPVESWRFQGHHGPRHSNPQMPLISEELWAKQATLGKFRVPTRLVGQVDKYVPCTDAAPKSVELSIEPGGQKHAFTQAEMEGTLYLVSRPAGSPPEIGDLRVRFERAPCEEVSVLAVQADDVFRPMKATDRIDGDGRVCFDEDAEDRACGCFGLLCCLPGGSPGWEIEQEEVFMVSTGRRMARQMLWEAESMLPRPRRWPNLSGLLCAIVGLGLVGSVLPGAFEAIPYAGKLVESFGLIAVWATALVLGAVLGYITAALAWFQARPLRALVWLLVAALISFTPSLYRYYLQRGLPAVAGS